MRRHRRTALAVTLTALAAAAAASTAGAAPGCGKPPVVYAANGHAYQTVCQKDVLWDAANAGATARGGHLVTISDAAENAFAFSVADVAEAWRPNGLGIIAGPWIGLLQAEGAQEPDGGWGWVTGEPFA